MNFDIFQGHREPCLSHMSALIIRIHTHTHMRSDPCVCWFSSLSHACSYISTPGIEHGRMNFDILQGHRESCLSYLSALIMITREFSKMFTYTNKDTSKYHLPDASAARTHTDSHTQILFISAIGNQKNYNISGTEYLLADKAHESRGYHACHWL
jgi:hypothetical protein